MAILTNLSPASSYVGLLNLVNTTGLTTALQVIQDGFGNNTTISVSTTETSIGGTFSISGTPLTATATQINNVCANATFAAFTSELTLPTGTTAQRPVTPINGSIRYNTTTSKVEAYANGSWQNLTA